MGSSPPLSVGLGGDGDEIAAVRDVEEEFGVVLDYADAPSWDTAGDLYASLCKALPKNGRPDTDHWIRFVTALSRETGVDPALIGPDSPLLTDRPVNYWLIGLFIGAIGTLA